MCSAPAVALPRWSMSPSGPARTCVLALSPSAPCLADAQLAGAPLPRRLPCIASRPPLFLCIKQQLGVERSHARSPGLPPRPICYPSSRAKPSQRSRPNSGYVAKCEDSFDYTCSSSSWIRSSSKRDFRCRYR